jgi:hypothetical protein
MSILAQAVANAANARLSTGPRTEEGKAKSSRNAVRHGLSARNLVILPGQEQEFEELRADLLAEIEPGSPLETITFNQLLHAAWNQHRCRAAEASLMADGRNPLVDESASKILDRIYRYAAAADRAYHRALKELRTLQTGRIMRQAVDDEMAEAIPTLADVASVDKQLRLNHRTDSQAFWYAIRDLWDVPVAARKRPEEECTEVPAKAAA